MKILEDIREYILFIEKMHGLNISLHTKSFDGTIHSKELSAFNIHGNSYCSLIKSCPEAAKHCVEKQAAVAGRAAQGAYSGVCFAGVAEFVFPIKECCGFISVGGLKHAGYRSYLAKIEEKYRIPYSALAAAYEGLDEKPDKKMIETLINPLIAMLSEAYREYGGKLTKNDFASDVKEYIRLNRTSKLTTEDICKKFSCSRSYMSRKFNAAVKKSFSEYLTELRLSDAEFLLKNTGMNITEIAFSVGFSDSDYFSTVFKRKKGMPPSAYRKSKATTT